MTQFYIVEIQKTHSGEYSHLVHWAFDENPDVARQKGESVYHSVLASAAISDTAEHSAIMFSTEGFPLMNQCYKHEPLEPSEE